MGGGRERKREMDIDQLASCIHNPGLNLQPRHEHWLEIYPVPPFSAAKDLSQTGQGVLYNFKSYLNPMEHVDLRIILAGNWNGYGSVFQVHIQLLSTGYVPASV